MDMKTYANDLLHAQAAAQAAVAPCPHTYGAGTRLSNYYTMGRDGLPCPGHAGPRDSTARKAYARGKADRAALAGQS